MTGTHVVRLCGMTLRASAHPTAVVVRHRPCKQIVVGQMADHCRQHCRAYSGFRLWAAIDLHVGSVSARRRHAV